jgi:dTDP-glucose 4,6-dehydratase
MKLIIFGHNGWIGGSVLNLVKQLRINYVLTDARADDKEAVEQLFQKEQPTHVFSLIGRTSGTHNGKVYQTIDYLEQKGRIFENVRDNLFSPVVLAILCKKYNIHLTYMGTGCIFSYDDDHSIENQNGFNENSKPNFFGSGYSTVKGFTDQIMHLFEDTVLNLRIRMPISADVNPKNFITKISRYEKICSISNSMTVLDELLPMALDMMQKNITGTMNLTNPGAISHNEILQMYKEIVDPNFTWKNFTIEEQAKILDAGRSNNFLDTTRLQTLYPQVKNISDSVRDTLHQMKVHVDSTKTALPKVNLLVTGGCGFIGSNFINIMAKRYSNYHFVNIDCLHYCANEFNVDDSIRKSTRYTFINDRIQDTDLVQILEKNSVDYVIHFAAQSHVDNSFTDQMSFIDDNIVATYKLLEASRIYGKLKKFLHVSTDEVYGDYNTLDSTELTRLQPTNPYSATKASAEMMVMAYASSFKLPIVISRGNNCFGQSQHLEKLLPKFIKLLSENKKCTIHGSGTNTRTFIHVDDTVDAFDVILQKGIIGEIYNIGSYDRKSIVDLTKTLIIKIKKTDNPDDWIEFIPDRPHNDKHYNINFDKLMALGWYPKVSFDKGIDQVINWYIKSFKSDKNYVCDC